MNKNKTTQTGVEYVLVELGDKLWFGGSLQQMFTVEEFINERPHSNGVDLFQLWKDTKVLPINFTQHENYIDRNRIE